MTAERTSRRGVLLGLGTTAAVGPAAASLFPPPVKPFPPVCQLRLAEALDDYEATQQQILAAENERDSIRLGPQIRTEAGIARDADLECKVDSLYEKLHAIRDEAAAIPASSSADLKLKAAWVRASDDPDVLGSLLRDVEALR